ncbi:MAG: coproporphyrinogen III oxidase [Planctomycetota bacterium]|jgi:coproporphyrinogen III oxidase
MSRTYAKSPAAARALKLVRSLQSHFVQTLEGVGSASGAAETLESVEWLRTGGSNGGGRRIGTDGSANYNRASVNVSQVHYDDNPGKKLGSATALSAIVHPANPCAPSIHVHVSWTEYKSGEGYWRIMADLNPALPDDDDLNEFETALRDIAPDLFEQACEEGRRYFWIPSLERHRGISHFYLEAYNTNDPVADQALAERVTKVAIDTYGAIVRRRLTNQVVPTEDELSAQLAYHTVYLFQVLTLDRGTTAGLLVHDENDLGILGSLPAKVDSKLLGSWEAGMSKPQDELVVRLVEALGESKLAVVDDAAKARLAQVLRDHYKKHPQALELQASASTRPPSIENHQ